MSWLKAALVLALAGIVAMGAFVWSGLYDISATDQHLRPTYHVMELAMDRSVERRAKDIAVPPLDVAQLARGAALFDRHCVACHGAPGVAPQAFALGLRPLPVPLVRTGKDKEPGFIYWVVKNGIKMTGMPAFDFRMGEDELWAVVAFVRRLPLLTPAEYATFPRATAFAPLAEARPDPGRGKRALEQFGCVACHQIPGLVGPEARLGPTLHGIGARATLGGVVANTPENMVRWLREPQKLAPGTAMPDVGLTERDARDIAAHLATLR